MDWRAVLERQSFADDDAIDIAATLLALSAADAPDHDLTDIRIHMEELPLGLSGNAEADKLRQRMAVELGYGGDSDTYDDMRNADIAQVVARRRGLPVALGLLYMVAARAHDWQIEGMNFPGHFLLRLTTADGPAIIDPFGNGQTVQVSDLKRMLLHLSGGDGRLTPQHMAGVPARQVLLRLQNNIKIRAQQAGNTRRTIDILERMSLFAPAETSVWLEWSGIEAGQGNMRRAIGLLEQGADHAPDERSLQAMFEARRALRRRLN